MIFPITELLDEHESQAWVEKYFHPKGLHCPRCGAPREKACEFRRHKRGVVDYRCHHCQRTYTLYTGTIRRLVDDRAQFSAPFRGVHKKYLHHSLTRCAHKINLKCISPKFIARLVAQHRSVT